MIDHTCPAFISFILDNKIRKRLHDPNKVFSSYLNYGDTGIDLGCGPNFFTIPMSKIVGNKGRIIAVDLQQKMLDKMLLNASMSGIHQNIIPIQCSQTDINVNQKADFALVFWMLHELGNKSSLLQQLYSILKPGGYILISEPKLHTSKKYFSEIKNMALGIGFKIHSEPAIIISRSIVFTK
jgi:ubiquinone/menaquinone biosynthesis C-methylase UbiE